MATAPTPPPRTVAESHWLTLHDVTWETYCQLRDAESNNSVRMTYLDGELTLVSSGLHHDGEFYGCILLHDVAWETYCRLRDAPENNSVRMNYLDGELALMSPELRHDGDSQLLGQLVRAAMTVMGLGLHAIGSTTLRLGAAPRPKRGTGKEPDAAFYLGDNERRIRGLQKLDLSVDPPPDLAIEVEHSNELTESEMTVYARLGVPEVWRFRVADRSISIHRLDGGAYREVDRSVALPRLTPTLIVEALDRFHVGEFDELGWFEWVKAWVRTLPGPDPAI